QVGMTWTAGDLADLLPVSGMMIRPKGNQLEITFSTSDTESWDGFIHNLNSFLSPYNDSYQVQTNDECTPDEYFIQEDSGEVRNNPKRSCQFNRTMLEECSGVLDRFYGYDKGQPCILIKLNRVIGMLPGKDRQSPYVTCAAKRYRVGENEWREDSDKIGPLAYYPPNGTFNLMYYPYYGKKAQVNYTQPLVAVKFLNASLNTDINVECSGTPGCYYKSNIERNMLILHLGLNINHASGIKGININGINGITQL
uniref:Sodium/potassium-transporting ATPase subunit beta n=1 Tax=Pundamilia nyererei TaxID=303518 RepID=A0A3B4FE13_9CICH